MCVVGDGGIFLDCEGRCFMSFLVMIHGAQIWNIDFF